MNKPIHYQIPYLFVLKLLYPVRPSVKKMLGGYALYSNKSLLLFLRDCDTQLEFNGVFVATSPPHFAALQQEIHTSKMDFDLDGTSNSWIFISEDLDEFEAKTGIACTLIKQGDLRIGRHS